MELLRASDLILALHRFPENHFDKDQSWKSFEVTLRRLCEQAGKRKMTLHLRLGPGRPPGNIEEAVGFVDRVSAANLRLAPSTAWMLAKNVDPQKAATQLADKVGLWLVSSFKTDAAGVLWNTNAPIGESKTGQALAKILSIARQAPIVFDAVYKNQDEEYAEVRALTRLGIGAV
jgi:sugar phosphate isomerase/epimerase